jgi:hypothetical protein
MSKDKLTDHPNEVVVLPGIKTVPAKPSLERAGSHGNDGHESADVQAGSAPSTGTRTNPRQPFRGRPRGDETDVLQVCTILRTVLNDQGDTWGGFSEPSPSASDVDATATDEDGNVLRVQVTRVDRAAAKTLARGDPVNRRRSVGQQVTDIRAAVDSNARRHTSIECGELLLALDAIRSPGHVDGAVVDAFLTAHQTYVAGLGYRAVWLVGPTGEMSRQVG